MLLSDGSLQQRGELALQPPRVAVQLLDRPLQLAHLGLEDVNMQENETRGSAVCSLLDMLLSHVPPRGAGRPPHLRQLRDELIAFGLQPFSKGDQAGRVFCHPTVPLGGCDVHRVQ